MKTFATTLIALLIGVSAFAQQDFPRNEVSLNLATTAFAQYPEISFERIMAEDFTIGASLGFRAGGDYVMNFNFTPFARWFFGGRHRETMRGAAAGFFIEANTSAYSVWDSPTVSDFGIGLGIGWKYLSLNNWTGELLLGMGRGLTTDTVYPRVGISIGRRF